MTTGMPILLRGGPRNRWAYSEKSWKELRSSITLQRARGQLVIDDALQYQETREHATLPSGDAARVWRWQG